MYHSNSFTLLSYHGSLELRVTFIKQKHARIKHTYPSFFHSSTCKNNRSQLASCFFTHLGIDRLLLVPCFIHSVLQNNILYSTYLASFTSPTSACGATIAKNYKKNKVEFHMQYCLIFRNTVQCLQLNISY